MTVKDIFEYLNHLYPVSTACDFDNPGLLVGDGNSVVTKALIALDCTFETAREAKNEGCQLIITHHPVIFSGIKNVVSGSIVYELIKNGISVLDAMCIFALEEGGFAHIEDGKLNGVSSEKGLCAFSAYYRFINEKAPLYDMSDVDITTPDAGDMNNNVTLALMALLSALAVMGVVKRKR
jgi:LPXTG-motif cell wall-anchored protein